MEFDPTELKLTRLASLLTIKQASGIALTILSILAGVFALGFNTGTEWVDAKRHLSMESPATISAPSAPLPPTNRANPK